MSGYPITKGTPVELLGLLARSKEGMSDRFDDLMEQEALGNFREQHFNREDPYFGAKDETPLQTAQKVLRAPIMAAGFHPAVWPYMAGAGMVGAVKNYVDAKRNPPYKSVLRETMADPATKRLKYEWTPEDWLALQALMLLPGVRVTKTMPALQPQWVGKTPQLMKLPK